MVVLPAAHDILKAIATLATEVPVKAGPRHPGRPLDLPCALLLEVHVPKLVYALWTY